MWAAAYLIILAFAGVTTWNIDRFPQVHSDEPWRLSPGYKFFSQGVFGSDLHAGFLGLEKNYFEFMPLMPLVEGAITHVLGLGVWQMRLASVLLGTLTMLLAFRLAHRLGDPLAAVIVLVLLMFWQWTPGGDAYLASGVPLVDVSRIARYDVLAALLGLGALYCAARSDGAAGPSPDLLSGALAGLAGLTHVYGFFWVPVLLLLVFLDGLQPGGGPAPRRAALVLMGTIAVCSVWVAFALAHWHDFVEQTLFFHRDQMLLLDPSFYARNLLGEYSRYRLGLRNPAALGRSGLWLLLFGVPAAILWTGRRAVRQRDREARVLLVPVLALPLLFALLIRSKTTNYLVSFVPPVALLVARWMAALLRSPQSRGRMVVQAALTLTLVQGAWGIAHMLSAASRAEPPDRVLRELREAVPAPGRILGPPQYWLAFGDRDFRSLNLAFMLSSPRLNRPISIEAAMREIAPRFVILPVPPYGRAAQDSFRRFMADHRARIVREMRDANGALVRVYELDL